MVRLNNETAIHNIRLISKGLPIELTAEETNDFLDILLAHNCHYMIWNVKLPSTNKKIMLYKSMIIRNKSVVQERYKFCTPFFDTLAERDIPYAVYKGAVLSVAAYDEPFYRQSGDIDVLVRKEDAEKIKKILNDIGFIQGRLKDDIIVPYSRKELVFHLSMTHQTAPFIMQTSSDICPFVNLDMNFDVMWGESNISADMNYILSQTEIFTVGNISIKKLIPIIDFIAVCLHHYKDANSIYLLYNGSLKLSLYTDIYYYLKNNANKICPDELADICERLNISKYVYYCIYHAHLVFDDDILLPYIETLNTSDSNYLLDKFGLDEHERKTWNWDFFDRILNPDFQQKFAALLDNSDMQKIQLNSEIML